MNPASLHVAQSFFHRFVLPLLDVLPQRLAENVDPVLKLFESFWIANQIGEFPAKSIIVVTVLINSALLVALPPEILNELLLRLIQAPAHSLTQAPHRIELLHAILVIMCEHILPPGDLLLVIDLKNSLVELGNSADTFRCRANRLRVLRVEAFIAA